MDGFNYGTGNGSLYNTTDGSLYASQSVINPGQIEFRAVRQASGTVDNDLLDVSPVRDAFGLFSSGSTLQFEDSDGTKQADYPYGQRVEIQYSTDGGSNWSTLFAGLVHDTNRTTRNGLPNVEGDIVSYDHLLRRRKVYKDYSSTTRSDILKDLIENFTPVDYLSSNVTVVNDETVDLPLRGNRVDEAIDQLSSGSANEEWGVNENFEFFFREQDISRAPEINDSDVIQYDLPEEGKRAINRFKLFYGSNGDEFVVVEDRESQKDLKDKLGASSRVVISDSDTFTEITTEERAEAVAREQLGKRSVIQTGTVRLPLGRFDTDSGDVLSVTINDAGITNTDFRIAQIDWNWLDGFVEFTIAENRNTNIDSLLKNLSDSLSNVRARDADTGATGTRYLEQQSGVEMSISASVKTRSQGNGFVLGQSQHGKGTDDKLGGEITGSTIVSTNTQKVTRALLNMARDVWQGQSFTDITHIGVGSDDSAAALSDNSLQNAIDRRVVESFSAGTNTDDFILSGRIGPGGNIADAADIEEIGFFNSDTGGNCYLRSTLPATAIDSNTELIAKYTVTINNNDDRTGVITNTGQERLRDLIVGETGDEPTDMVYGTDTTNSTVGDSSLGNKVHEDAINSFVDRSTGKTDIIERIGSGEVNGNDIAEIGYENSSNELLARITIEPLSKTSDFALETNYGLIAENA